MLLVLSVFCDLADSVTAWCMHSSSKTTYAYALPHARVISREGVAFMTAVVVLLTGVARQCALLQSHTRMPSSAVKLHV